MFTLLMYAEIGLDYTLFVEKKSHVYITYVCRARDRFRQYGTEIHTMVTNMCSLYVGVGLMEHLEHGQMRCSKQYHNGSKKGPLITF